MNRALTDRTVDAALLRGVVRRFVAAGDPIRIVLFGSHARGDAHKESELGLLVIEESHLPRWQGPSVIIIP